MTSMADGDLAVSGDPATLETRRRAVVDLPWTWLHQEHGAAVVVVDRPGQHAGEHADAAVSAVPGAALAVQVADCAPVALVSSAGAVGIAHVGWRGLVAGVLPAAVSALIGAGRGNRRRHRSDRAVHPSRVLRVRRGRPRSGRGGRGRRRESADWRRSCRRSTSSPASSTWRARSASRASDHRGIRAPRALLATGRIERAAIALVRRWLSG